MTPGRLDLLVEKQISPAAPDLRLVYVVRTSRYWSTPYIRHAGVYTPYHTVVHLVPTVLSTGVLIQRDPRPLKAFIRRILVQGKSSRYGPSSAIGS